MASAMYSVGLRSVLPERNQQDQKRRQFAWRKQDANGYPQGTEDDERPQTAEQPQFDRNDDFEPERFRVDARPTSKAARAMAEEAVREVAYLAKEALIVEQAQEENKLALAESGPAEYLVDNSVLQAHAPGITFRFSKRMEDRDDLGELAAFGTSVLGIDEGDGWLRVQNPHGEIRYLPTEIQGVTVLSRAAATEQREAREERRKRAEAAERQHRDLEAWQRRAEEAERLRQERLKWEAERKAKEKQDDPQDPLRRPESRNIAGRTRNVLDRHYAGEEEEVPDHYQVLGVPRHATPEEITQAYRALANLTLRSFAMAAIDRTRGNALELQAEQGMKLLKANEASGAEYDERSAKGKEVADLKNEHKYVDACKIVKGLEPKFGHFVTKEAVKPEIEADEPEAAENKPKKEPKKEKKAESAGLSPAETKELEDLKQKIIEEKAILKEQGLSGGQINKDSDENPEYAQLQGDIEVYKAKLRTEFGYSNKDMKADPDLKDNRRVSAVNYQYYLGNLTWKPALRPSRNAADASQKRTRGQWRCTAWLRLRPLHLLGGSVIHLCPRGTLYHPDRLKSSGGVLSKAAAQRSHEQRMALLNAAHRVLSDQRLRLAYDKTLPEPDGADEVDFCDHPAPKYVTGYRVKPQTSPSRQQSRIIFCTGTAHGSLLSEGNLDRQAAHPLLPLREAGFAFTRLDFIGFVAVFGAAFIAFMALFGAAFIAFMALFGAVFITFMALFGADETFMAL
eukprot:s26_g9.t1